MDNALGTSNPPSLAKPREDILVSICFSDIAASENCFATLRDIADLLDSAFRFREIILVVDHSCYEDYLPLVEQISDLRLLTVRPGTNHYHRRVIAAEEAIGDVVLIGASSELRFINPIDMLERAALENTILLATRANRSSSRSWLFAPIIALGRVSGFKVNLNDLQTVALPRSQLNQILSHSDPELALRFPPRDPRLPLSFFSVESEVPFAGGLQQLGRRIQLLQKLLVYIAPILLMFVTVSSSLLTLLGLCYAVYMTWAFVFLDNLTPGWITTSAMLSLSATFMGVSILGLSLGLQQILSLKGSNSLERVAHEINRIDLFGKVASDLNVSIDREAQRANKEVT